MGDTSQELHTERRTKLDGGLNTRTDLFSKPDEVSAISNLRFTKGGSLTKRRGGKRLRLTTPYVGAGMPGPTLTQIAGGTLADGTYKVAYALTSINGGVQGSAQTTLVVAAGGGTAAIKIIIPPLNSGEGVGQVFATTGGADDPLGSQWQFQGVYALVGADALSKQTVTQTNPFFDPTGGGYHYTLSAYTTNGAVYPATTANQPIRSLVYHPGLRYLFGWTSSEPFFFRANETTQRYMSSANDISGNALNFSRVETPIHSAFIDGVMVCTDGVGKPKRLNWTAGLGATSAGTGGGFCTLGANPPAAAPTTVANAAAGNPNGTYTYVYTWVYQITRPDGTTYQIESNASPVSTPALVVASKKIDVTMPKSLETTAFARNLYRTITLGSTYFLVAQYTDDPTTNITKTDNVSDANLGPQRPPDSAGKVPNDPPLPQLHFMTQYAQRLWAVRCNWDLSNNPVLTSYRIFSLIPTNQIYFSKGPINSTPATAGPGTQIGTTQQGPDQFDYWPSTFTVLCGESSAISALKVYGGRLFIFKADEIGVIDGDTDASFEYRTIFTNYGAMENSVISVDRGVLFWDQAKGPCLMTVAGVQELGTDSVQESWRGNRSSLTCNNVVYDRVNNEVRWSFSTPPINVNGFAVPTGYVEYVLFTPTAAWGKFTGAAQGGAFFDRMINAACNAEVRGTGTNPVYRFFDSVYGDFLGRIVDDDQNEYDLDPAPAAIPFSATFTFFFGNSPEMVKVFKYLYTLVVLGATGTDTMQFSVASLSKQGAPTGLTVWTGGGATANQEQMARHDVPAKFDGTNSQERGLLVSVSGSAQSGPTKIQALATKYVNVSDTRNAP